ncbi:hypothetical protein PF002_g3922 [Phytophthora fragariae]|uniref:RING-type domain-containing protein n=1 Tax=Phytophthora fragariae TaxID=53985 RepID=A0A6A4A5H9_9STRA|nr:hypothetical protein PF002_g3922 [Phytophthora fragariae]
MSEENDDTSVDQALQKAQSLLTIVNKHFDVMMSGSTSSDNPEQEGDSESVRAIQDIVADLTEVQWLPVRLEAPDPAMPWKNLAESGSRRFSSASKMRPLKDAWFCSSSMDILDGELTSEELIAAFGWKEQIDSFVIAKQLEAIGIRWEDHRRKKDAGEPMASKTPTWRFPLSEIHLMYEEVESHRLSDEEGWTMSPVHRKLANALWIWTGNRFAYPCQIAVEADASLEPLLYSCPSEHIIPRSLIASFGLKEKFTTVDYLEAIMRLPRSTILEEMQIAACLKIYEIVGGDTSSLETGMNSFVSQEMVLLDHSARLIPAVQLTFDDMEWNESREVRRGATFVSKGVPKDVARLLGAASLHSKLAQTSVTSRRVVCPPAVALQNVLPPRSEWYRAFLWETILAAERFGGTQVDFFLDTRHHSSQRVIQPSLQPLQDEALCIHIHDMVLSEDDINNLFHGETSRAGLLCGFVVSDCMQILSGDGFYILDPTGCYLSSSAGGVTIQAPSSGRAQSIGRRYEVLGQDFVRYPDQLLPFTTLPACQSNISRGTGSTLIRFPWRKTGSVVSSYVLDARKADKLVSFLKSQLFQTLIFTESVHRISVWSVGKESEYASHCHGEVSLDSPDGTLRKRNMTRQNQEWKKKFSLQSFFKSPVIPENQMEIVVNLELENRQYQDTWLFADNIGLGRSRDLACTAVHEMLHSTPYVSVACHIFRDGSPAPRLRGHIYKIVDTHQQVGLPVHINGCFKKSIKDKQLTLTASSNQISSEAIASGASGSEQQVAAGWNRILLEDGASDAYVKLLLVAKRRYERSFPKSLYNIWPTLQKREDGKELGALVQAHTFHTIDMRELFLCTDGIFRALGSGYQLDIGGMNIQVSSFAQLHFPAFDVPSRILQDCSRLLPSRMYAVTPKVMRRFLRSVSSSEVHSDICLSLLEYCLSDLSFPLPSDMDPVWTEFHGLSLLPLEDGSIGVLRVNQRRTSYVLASFNQIELLRPLGHLFVSLAASRRLAKYFSDSRFTTIFGLVSFSIKTLSDNIERVLPSSWKNQAMIEWDPSSPVEIDELWLYRFWQVVHFERRSLGYFSSWPLIPVKGSRLVSCGKMDKAICVWDGSADSEISAQVAELFQASAMQQEKKMADFDAERKRLMELSSAKFQTEEELAEDTYSDEEVDGDEEVEEVDEEEGDEEDVEGEGENESDGLSGGETEEAVQLGDIPSSALENEEYPRILESFSNDGDDVAEVLSPTSISLDLDNVSDADGAETAEIGEGFALPVYPVEDEPHEFCSRETLHNVLTDLNISMVELAYLGGQESDIVPRSADLGLTVLDGIFASDWEHLRWGELGETKAVLIAEFFSHNGDTYGGYNRVQMERLKQLPIFVNIGNVPCAIHGGQDFFLIPPGLNLTDMPLPPDARQRFLKSNPGLNAFYRELGVEEMSDRKLLIAELTALLRTSPLFRTEEGEGENLSPLMFEVPRAFGAYDALFRHMGSKEAPEVNDYIRLLRDLNEECCGHPLNLNELIASARAIDLLATAISESSRRLSLEEKNAIFLPSNTAVMQSMLLMAYNDSAALCSSIDLTELHVVHPRISTRCCKILGVPGITSVVTEELDGEDNPTELLARDDIAHFNSVLASQQFADGLRKIITAQQQKASSYDAFGFIPDFEDLNHRIVNLATYEVNCVAELQSRFIAKLDFPARRIDVTKTARQESLSFLDQTRRRIYIAKCTLEARSEMGMRASHLVARCINQLLGGVLQDCSVLESILTCDEVEIPRVLQLLDIYEDPVLIVENLRGVLGQPLSEVDCANVELAPLRSCLPGELVAVEDESGTLCYGKILREQASNVAGVSQFEVKVASSSTRLLLATQLYFFRSARVGTSSGSSNTTTSERPAEDLVTHSDNIAMPASVVALASESQDGAIVSGFSHVKAPPSAVSSSNVLSAVNDLLSRLNVTLDTSVEELMAENLRLQRRLEVAEASRRAAATQIDAAIREKKEVQDSLVCAVCLENKVNRVLIPCGHIYCASCVGQLPRPSCPICRQNIVSSSVFHVPS